jgi:hypothetical protein
MKIPRVAAELLHTDRQTERQTDMTKLMCDSKISALFEVSNMKLSYS